MATSLTPNEESQLLQTIEMFEVITQEQPLDYQSLEILKEAYFKLGRQKEVIQTSKRIAQAYMQLGQLSSAILEYEGILQKFPDDPEVKAALAEIESKATSLAGGMPPADSDMLARDTGRMSRGRGEGGAPADFDDGRQSMQKLFIEGKVIGAGDFDNYWPKVDLTESPGAPVEPFIQILADKGVQPVEKSLKMLSDKTRLGYLPADRYDLDVELGRQYPKDVCRRWCVVPVDRMSKSIIVATANPFNKQAARDLEAVGKQRLIWYLSPPADLVKAIRKVFR